MCNTIYQHFMFDGLRFQIILYNLGAYLVLFNSSCYFYLLQGYRMKLDTDPHQVSEKKLRQVHAWFPCYAMADFTKKYGIRDSP